MKYLVDGPKDTPPDIALKKTYIGIDKDAIKIEFQNWIQQKEKEAEWLVFPE